MVVAGAGDPALVVVMKGYPRLSETFIAQELLALQRLGLAFSIWSLRHPTDGAVHLMHRQISAPLHYLPEYLHDAPARVLRGAVSALRRRGLIRLLVLAARDLARDPTRNRLRRLGQALVMARELPAATRHLHVHYLHTPASVVRYAALLRGLTWSFSAHAKDIWTTDDWEKREKIAASAWGVTCTAEGAGELRRLAPTEDHVQLVYHGLDLARFPEPPERMPRDGRSPESAIRLVTVGRAVEKKGFDDLIEALAALPPDLHWHLTHIGGGERLAALKALAATRDLETRIEWRGPQVQQVVIETLQAADIFVLPSKAAAGGDRDGLPNVVMEAASQALPILATRFAGIPEFVRHDVEGWLSEPGDVARLSHNISALIGDADARLRLGQAALRRLRADFSAEAGITRLHGMLRHALDAAGTDR
jgi:glycosyltransferase involved in cell wall biosynthesis